MSVQVESPLIQPLSKNHDRTGFACGNDGLDKYLQVQAGQDAKRNVSACFVLVSAADPDSVAGYYTLSATAIDPGELESNVRKQLPPYPLIPATLIGRLARNLKFKGGGIGEYLLMDALNRSLTHSKEIASFAVVVDAIDLRIYNWYSKEWGFIPLKARSDRLYLPMKTVQKLFEG
jgi:hypothetical protein